MSGFYFNDISEDCIGDSILTLTNTCISGGTSATWTGTFTTDCGSGFVTDNPKRVFIIETASGADNFGPYDASNPIPPNVVLTVAPFNGLVITLSGDYINPTLSVTTGFSEVLRIRSIFYAEDQCGSFASSSATCDIKWKQPEASFDITQVVDGEHSFTDTSIDCGCPGGILTWAWTGYDSDNTTVLWTSNIQNPPNYTYTQTNIYYLVELTITTDCGTSFTFRKFVFWPSDPPDAGITIDPSDCRAMILETTGSVDGIGTNIEDEVTAVYSLDWFDSTNNRFIATISGSPFSVFSFDWSLSQLTLLSASDQANIETAFTGSFGTSGFGNSIIMNKEDIFNVLYLADECTIDAIEFEFIETVTYQGQTSINDPSVFAPICCEAGQHNFPLYFEQFDAAGNLFLGGGDRLFAMIQLPRSDCNDQGFKKNIAGDPNDIVGDVPATPADGQISAFQFRPNGNLVNSITPDIEDVPINHPILGPVNELFAYQRGNDYAIKLTPNPLAADKVNWQNNFWIERLDIQGNLGAGGSNRANIQIIPGIRENKEPVFMMFNSKSGGVAELKIVYFDGASWISTVIHTEVTNFDILSLYWATDDSGIYFSSFTIGASPQNVALLQFSGTKDVAGLINPANYTYRLINQFTNIGAAGTNSSTLGIIDLGTSSNGLPIIYWTRRTDTSVIYKSEFNGGATLTPADWNTSVVYTRGSAFQATSLALYNGDLYMGTLAGVEQLDISVEPFTFIRLYSGRTSLGTLESKKF